MVVPVTYTKQCKNCETKFDTETYRQQKCKPSCGRQNSNQARTVKQELNQLDFIGVDGEGINGYVDVEEWDDASESFIVKREMQHQYVLLSVGRESLHKNGRPLTHDEIFTFLWEQYLANPDAAFVGFFLGYDFTNWLKTIPVHAAAALLTKDGIEKRRPTDRFDLWPVRDGKWGYHNGHRKLLGVKWEFDLMAGKRFKLRPYIPYDEVPTTIVTHRDGTQETKKITRPWMYICDTGPFFQSSFLAAIHPKQWETPVVTQDEYDLIERGKQHRSDAQFDDDMIRYNLLENVVLARVMERINEGFVSDGIRLGRKQWFGPGQAAQKWMANIGVPTGEQVREVVPQYARDAARATYYGGWFEIFNHGPVPGNSYAYDINSAYPTVIANLPCLLHGKWSRGDGAPGRLPKNAIRMIYATVKGNDPWVGAMPHRQPDGSILRPHQTKGWYWWHEVKASQRAGLINQVETEAWVTYEPCQCLPPMASIRELYEGRLAVGKNSAAGKGKKHVYNSSYGKFAQSVGQPKFANPIYASLITAGCRTMILNAIATHPTRTDSLLMVATDGIVFKTPHPSLDIDPERLGAWDAETYENLSLFMPGLYWDDKTRELVKEGKTPKLKSRGVAARDLSKVIDRVDKQWGVSTPESPFPKISLTVEWGMITAKQAIVRNKWYTCGQIVYGAQRKLSGDPSAKRHPWMQHKWGGLRTTPYPRANQLETTPYERGFGEERLDPDDIDDMVTPDGTIGELRAWAFRR